MTKLMGHSLRKESQGVWVAGSRADFSELVSGLSPEMSESLESFMGQVEYKFSGLPLVVGMVDGLVVKVLY